MFENDRFRLAVIVLLLLVISLLAADMQKEKVSLIAQEKLNPNIIAENELLGTRNGEYQAISPSIRFSPCGQFCGQDIGI
jgi:hypothetical protein